MNDRRFNEVIARAERDLRQGPGFEVLMLAELRLLRKQLSTSRAPRLLGVKPAAQYLGATTWAIRRLVWENEVPSIRIGQRILFDIHDLDRFIEQSKTAVGA